MNKEKAIELLRKKDIKRIIKEIKNFNLKVIYWKSGEENNHEAQIWFINGDEMIDYLCYSTETYLHWTQVYEDLIKAIKKEIKYTIE